MNLRSDLITSIRGRYLCPIIATLSELRLLEEICKGPFRPAEFSIVKGQAKFAAVINYLVGVGICQPTEECGQFTLTRLGHSLLSRAGAHLILESYSDLFSSLRDILEHDAAPPPVDRGLNIRGSGLIHRKKFFPDAIQLFATEKRIELLDLGCGNGEFLMQIQEHCPSVRLSGVDLSPTAVAETQSRLQCDDDDVQCAPAEAIDAWAGLVQHPSETVISMWFVVHEFAKGKVDVVVDFFHRLAARLPTTDVMIGEIVAVEPSALASARMESVAPEFLLFHQLSGQGVLTWTDLKRVRERVPYDILHEIPMNPIATDEDGHCPSSLIWYMRPNCGRRIQN